MNAISTPLITSIAGSVQRPAGVVNKPVKTRFVPSPCIDYTAGRRIDPPCRLPTVRSPGRLSPNKKGDEWNFGGRALTGSSRPNLCQRPSPSKRCERGGFPAGSNPDGHAASARRCVASHYVLDAPRSGPVPDRYRGRTRRYSTILFSSFCSPLFSPGADQISPGADQTRINSGEH